MTFTDHDMRNQVTASIEGSGEHAGDYDVHAIVDALQERFGTTDIDDIPSDAYWAAVRAHQL